MTAATPWTPWTAGLTVPPIVASAGRSLESNSGREITKFLTNVYRNPALPLEARINAAGKAAAYVHPRLTAVTVGGDKEKPLPTVTRIEIVPVAPRPRDDLP